MWEICAERHATTKVAQALAICSTTANVKQNKALPHGKAFFCVFLPPRGGQIGVFCKQMAGFCCRLLVARLGKASKGVLNTKPPTRVRENGVGRRANNLHKSCNKLSKTCSGVVRSLAQFRADNF